MKRKNCIFIVCFIVVLFGILLGIRLYKKNKVVYSDLYLKYQYPEEEYFGKELYSEIDHQSSPDEIECGKEIIDKINQIADYKENEEDALNEGALNWFYYFYGCPTAVEQNLNVEFITCKLSQDTGHLWIAYDREQYDENGELACGSWNILALISLSKNANGEWFVTEIDEAP